MAIRFIGFRSGDETRTVCGFLRILATKHAMKYEQAGGGYVLISGHFEAEFSRLLHTLNFLAKNVCRNRVLSDAVRRMRRQMN
jgi:hypothetical protein